MLLAGGQSTRLAYWPEEIFIAWGGVWVTNRYRVYLRSGCSRSLLCHLFRFTLKTGCWLLNFAQYLLNWITIESNRQQSHATG